METRIPKQYAKDEEEEDEISSETIFQSEQGTFSVLLISILNRFTEEVFPNVALIDSHCHPIDDRPQLKRFLSPKWSISKCGIMSTKPTEWSYVQQVF